MSQNQIVFNILSNLLQYPSDDLNEYLDYLKDEVRLVEDDLIRNPILKFLSFVQETSYAELCRQYVSTFDFNEKTSLYLTYTVFKDNRERGPALVKLRQELLATGVELESDELPDYLPLILEFAAITEPEQAAGILRLHLRSMERLCLELEAINSPYKNLLIASISLVKNQHVNTNSPSFERRII